MSTYSLVGYGAFATGFDESLTPALPVGAVAGNLGILISGEYIGEDAVPSVTGWTNISPQVNARGLNVWARILTGSGDAPTVPAWGSQWAWAICGAYSGNPSTLSGIVSASVDFFSNSTVQLYYSALTIATSNCLVLAVGNFDITSAQDGANYDVITSGSFAIEAQDNVGAGTVMPVINDWVQTTATSFIQSRQSLTIANGSNQSFSTIMIALAPTQTPVLDPGHPMPWGPGVTPNKQTMFYPRLLSNWILPSGKMQARGYAQGYGYGALYPSSNLSSRGYAQAYGYAKLGALAANQAFLFRGPGISADWEQTFQGRRLASTVSSAATDYIASSGYAKGYGFANPSEGAMAARGFASAYGYARISGTTTAYATGYAKAYGFANGQGFPSAMYATGYAKGYGYAQPGIFVFLMPDVIFLLQAAATSLLNSLGLNVNVQTVNSTITPPGEVSQQNPIAGTMVQVGQTVTIFVSIGQYVAPPKWEGNLGYHVTSRTFSLEELVAREWGSEFRAPDHRIYVWSNNRSFDSTDIGNTGIYQKGTSTS